jgi:hypothetical protein
MTEYNLQLENALDEVELAVKRVRDLLKQRRNKNEPKPCRSKGTKWENDWL